MILWLFFSVAFICLGIFIGSNLGLMIVTVAVASFTTNCIIILNEVNNYYND